MPSDTLNKVIIENYDGFKKEINTLGRKHNIKFDDDIFNDTYIKCYEILKNREITEEGVKYYFWVAFLNNTRKKYRHSKYKPILSDLNENIYKSDNEDDENEDNENEYTIETNENTALFDEENYDIFNVKNNNEDNTKCQEKKYNDNFFKLCEFLKNAVIAKFGKEKYKIWSLHFINHKSYSDLINMGIENINFHNLFRQINSYLKNTLPKENKDFKKLLKNTLGI